MNRTLPPDHRPKLPRLLRRLRLTHDGRTFLDRWGLCHDRIGGFYIHHIAGPDPGLDLHDHPWTFISIVLSGGYTERRAVIHHNQAHHTGYRNRRRWSIARTRLDTAHRIIVVHPHTPTWTIVLRGPTRRIWGFYPPTGRVDWDQYDYATRRPSTKEIIR